MNTISTASLPEPTDADRWSTSIEPRLPHHAQLTFTQKEWVQQGHDKRLFAPVSALSRRTLEHHALLGTPRTEVEPPPTLVVPFLRTTVVDPATEALSRTMTRDVDPALDEAAALLDDAEALLAMEAHPEGPLQAEPEQGEFTAAAAESHVSVLQARIDADTAAGYDIHRPAPGWLRAVTPILPWIEAAGAFTFAAYWMNIDLLNPWPHLNDILLAGVMIGSTIGLQTFAVDRAAHNHNDARASEVDGRRDQAAALRKKRNIAIAGGGVLASLIATGLVQRMWATAATADPIVLIYLSLLAVVAAVAMPAIGYWVKATDGSPASREKIDLEAQLRERGDNVRAGRAIAITNVAEASAITRDLRENTLPTMVETFRDDVAEANALYDLSRAQIGNLPPVALERPRMVARFKGDGGELTGMFVQTNIPGMPAVEVIGLPPRLARLLTLEKRHAALQARLGLDLSDVWDTEPAIAAERDTAADSGPDEHDLGADTP